MPPTMLIDSLNGVRRKVKFLGIVMGAGVVVASAVALLLATVLLDFVLNLQSWPRFVVIAMAVCAIGYALNRWLIRPIMARLTLGDVAGRLEHAFPQFDDRLRSTVDFVDDRIPGSEAMKQRTVEEATRIAQQVDLRSAIATRPVIGSTSAGALALLLAAVLW